MNLFTQALHLIGSGATAYVTARNLRDPQTRPDLLAGFQLAEAGAVPFLTALSERAQTEGDAWLAERLMRHAEDERRHSQIFVHALRQLNKQVIDISNSPSNHSSNDSSNSSTNNSSSGIGDDSEKAAADKTTDKTERRRSPFFAAYYQGYSQADLAPATIDWTVFFLSTHILELDAGKDFVRMAAVLPDDNAASLNLKKALISIANDEKGHAAYLLEAARRRLSYGEVNALVDDWRERKVNALLAMVSNLLGKGGAFPSLARDGVPVEMSQDDSVAEPTAA